MLSTPYSAPLLIGSLRHPPVLAIKAVAAHRLVRLSTLSRIFLTGSRGKTFQNPSPGRRERPEAPVPYRNS
jgi:hypothetical protein